MSPNALARSVSASAGMPSARRRRHRLVDPDRAVDDRVFAVQAQVDEGRGRHHVGGVRGLLEFYSVRAATIRTSLRATSRTAYLPRCPSFASQLALLRRRAGGAARPLRRRAAAGRARRPRRRRRSRRAQAVRRAAAAARQPAGLSADVPPGLRRRLRDRARHRAEGPGALRQRRQLSHRLAGRRRAVQERNDAAVQTRRDEAVARRSSSTCAAFATTCARGATRGARKLFLLHGWMDVSASFQFLVDALSRRVARAGAGLARLRPDRVTPQDGYWFADYVADLDALVHALAPGEAVDIAGHSLGANVAMLYAGVRPATRRASSSRSTASAFPARRRERAPGKFAEWLDALRRSAGVRAVSRASRPSPTGCRRTIRGCRATRRSSWRRTGREALPDGTARLRADPTHKLPFPDRRTRHGGRLRDLARDHARRCCGSPRTIPTFRAGSPAAATPRPKSRAASRTCPDGTARDDRRRGPHAAPRPAGSGRARASKRSSRLMHAAPRRAFAARRLRRRWSSLTLIWGINWIVMKLALQSRAIRSCSTCSGRGSRRSSCSPCSCWQRRPLLAGVVARRRSSPASSRRRSISARRRWRWPAAAPDARRCSCSRCRSGRCCIAWPVLHERVQAAASGSRSRFALAGHGAGRRAVALAGRPRRPSCGRCCRGSAGRPARSPPSISSASTASTRSISSRGRCWSGVLPLTRAAVRARRCRATQWSVTYAAAALQVGAVSTALGFLLWIAVLRWLPAGTASLNMFAIPVIALCRRWSCSASGSRATSGSASRCIGAGLAIISVDAWRASRRGVSRP